MPMSIVEEIAENDLMVKLVREMIKTRKENHISQRESANMTGVASPARERLSR